MRGRRGGRAEARIDREQVAIARRELRMLLRHHGGDGVVSRLFMAHFLRQHPLPPSVYLEVARAAEEHPRRRGGPPRMVQLVDGRRALIDHTRARIERYAPGEAR